MTRQLDIVIVSHPKDFPTLDLAIRCALDNIEGVRRVFVVSSEAFVPGSSRAQFVPEPRSGFPTIDQVAQRWESENPSLAGRAGWIYQELLTLGAPDYIEDLLPSYLCIDADTIFVRPVAFLDEHARFLYTDSPYLPGPSVRAHRRLTGEDPEPRSFTAHHMLYDAEFLGELFAHVESLHGKPWFEAYLDCIDFRESSPISEQDVYANWVLKHHPEFARHRHLDWADLRYVPNERQRRRLARRYDFVSAHVYARQSRLRRVPNSLITAAGKVLERVPGVRTGPSGS